MPSRDKKVAVQKAKVEQLNFCQKCGSIMIRRMIADKNGSEKPVLISIWQCKVCRFWKRV